MVVINKCILLTIFIFLLSFFINLSFCYPKSNCDKKKWASGLIKKYNVTMVLTVDHNGCGNFSKIQDAIDNVGDSTSHATLIILNTGTYRYQVLWG
ncbi:pectinesterase, putative [Medicago truncatula]|uniref:Pectinesterase, putative n=1 Tax=Medicago truncatula TaxID=3880 RepID=G7L4W8_MEDTR|nr:pectinesterase, putative [Medicago truncatula]